MADSAEIATEKHYIMGQSRLAGRALARAVDAARKRFWSALKIAICRAHSSARSASMMPCMQLGPRLRRAFFLGAASARLSFVARK
jgi:hypothetical protein